MKPYGQGFPVKFHSKKSLPCRYAKDSEWWKDELDGIDKRRTRQRNRAEIRKEIDNL